MGRGGSEPLSAPEQNTRGAAAATRDGWVIALLLAVFVASRLAWLAWAPATSAYWEESYRWVAAHELLNAPSQPFLEYQADHYQGGSLAMILLSVPFFALFGESLATLKLSALSVSTAILLLLYLLSRRAFGRPVALLAAGAYVLGPPLVAFRGLVVMGSHWESLLFSLAQLLVFCDLLSGRDRSPARWLVFGALAGFGIWFCYTAALTTAACAVCWLLLEARPRPRELALATAGGLAGLVPWGLYNVRYEFAGVVRVLEIFGRGDPIDHWTPQGPVSKLWGLVSHDLPRGLVMPFSTDLPDELALALCAGFAVPFALAVAAAFVRALRLLRARFGAGALPAGADGARLRSEIVFPLYALVFLAVFLSSAYSVEPGYGAWAFRLFTPPAVLLSIPAAVTAVAAVRRGGWRRAVALPLCAVCLASSLAGTAALAARKPDVMQHPNPIIGYMSMGVLLHRKYEGDLGRAVAVARRIPDQAMRLRVDRGIGWGMVHRFEKAGSVAELERVLAALEPLDRAAVVRGLQKTSGQRRRSLAALVRDVGASAEDRRLLARLEVLTAFADEQWTRTPAGLRKTVSPES